MLNTTRKVKNFPDYEISEDGIVFNTKTSRLISPQLRPNGYVAVWLRNEDGRRLCSLHKILIESFVENEDNLPCVDHIDRNKQNNKLENLRYSSYLDNSRNRPRTKNNKLGKHITNSNPPYYRVIITNKGKRVYDKNFNKKHYSISTVRSFRNNALLKLGLPHLDETDLII